jgi:hypothetical protein
VTGSQTKDGNGWGVGPYDVLGDGVSPAGDAGPLPHPLEPDDHLLAIFTTVPPPDPTDGCVALEAPVPGAPLTVDITLGLTGPNGEAEVGGGAEGGVRVVPSRAGVPVPMGELSAIDWGDGQIDSPPNTSGGFVAHVYSSPATQIAIEVWDTLGGTGTSAPFDVI